MSLSSEPHVADDVAEENGEPYITSGTKRLKSQSQHADGKALREEKHRKWLAKNERKCQMESDGNQRESWFQSNAHFASYVTLQDLERNDMDNTLATLLQPYRNIQDKKKCAQRYFIAEGTETVRLLVQNQHLKLHRRSNLPPVKLQSVFIKTTAFFENPVNLRKDVEEAIQASDTQQQQKTPFSVLIGSEDVQSKVVGFPFCRGALACGVVPDWSNDEDWLWNYLKSHPRFQHGTEHRLCRPPLRIVALDGVGDAANLGSVVRSASAFGMDAVILSPDSCDVWYRKSVRVSMGHLCRLPVVKVPSLPDTIHRLQEELDVVAYAAVVTKATLVLENLKQGEVSAAWCCVIGNEGSGISKSVIEACRMKIKIGIDDGVDSLSVPVATGILLHGLKEREMR